MTQENRSGRWYLIWTFAFVALFFAYDLYDDLNSDTPLPHLIVEGVLASIAFLWTGLLFRTNVRLKRRLDSSEQVADHWRNEADRWREKKQALKRGLMNAIERQFADWGLSPTEREIALLLLKGLSLKEVASVRSTAESTVRKQAFAIYQKAGLTGRTDLSAFFLEDLLSSPNAEVAPPERNP